jgi:hypothetical protein
MGRSLEKWQSVRKPRKAYRSRKHAEHYFRRDSIMMGSHRRLISFGQELRELSDKQRTLFAAIQLEADIELTRNIVPTITEQY